MPKLLKIITEPNPILRKKSIEISVDDIKIIKYKKFYDDMALTMKKSDGVGLAAPQVAKNIRLIVVNTKDGVLCMANPKIIKKSFLKELGEEGCLSVPYIYGEVKRHKKIICTYINVNGKINKIKAEGFLARVLQHEIDHLDGILFTDKAKNIKSIKAMPHRD